MKTWPEFINKLNICSRGYQNSIDQNYRKNNGIYYTDFNLALYLIDELFLLNPNLKTQEIEKLTFFEPCVGVGMFVFAYLLRVSELLEKDKLSTAIKNIYVADIDRDALKLFVNNLKELCTEVLGIQFDEETYFSNNVTDKLLFSQRGLPFNFYGLKDSFNKEQHLGFDIVVTNPPYKNLKAEKNKFLSDDDYLAEKDYYSQISKYVKKHFTCSNNGVLNIYKLFVEEILKNYSNGNSYIILLIPSTILTDKSCTKLRELMFSTTSCQSINCIQENNKIFDGTQALSSLLLKKGSQTTSFRIDPTFEINTTHRYTDVDFAGRKNKEDNSVVILNNNDQARLDVLSKHSTIKQLQFIHNKRGELDLTANVASITDGETKYKLLRGRDIDYYFLRNNYLDFVDEDFVNSSAKSCFVHKSRIACQQISNLNKERRLTFSYIPEDYILGNSCNFISCDENEYGIDIFYLLGLLNCSIMNWFFKLKSSNNHVNNYEIDEFPIPTSPVEDIKKISQKVREMLSSLSLDNQKEIDDLCTKILLGDNKISDGGNTKKMKKDKLLSSFSNDLGFYLPKNESDINNAKKLLECGIGDESIKLLVTLPTDSLKKKALLGTIEKYQRINKYNLLNHIPFKLSDLDLEMISCVPQGGSWKDIKPEIVQKSKRLVRITQTGGRTTLYGRIDYSKPAYTITTYFNRPGNGTYVHPIHNRVISPREAARIQSFSDDYYFYGSKTDLLDQIGNAVPPLMAKAIALQIKSKIDVKNSLDLFVGAGGLTSGFEQAGIKSLCGVDFVENACATLKINYPHIDVICGDLTLDETKQKIYESIKKDRIDLIVGGPPCQGFSMAGKRFIDDPRNKLFKEYLDILKHLMPKAFLMENVDGMKSMQQGKVYEEIIRSFTEAGYSVEGRLLMANEYGVPQKRKRLIIIGVRNDIGVSPSDLYPNKIDKEVTARDAIVDLENVPCSSDATYPEVCETTDYIKSLRKKMN